MYSIDHIFVAAAVLLLASVLASKASSRLGIPALLLFLAIGMLAGSDGPGGIQFDNAAVAQLVGVVALSFILFAGGLDTEWKSVRGAVGPALSLSTAGVLITAAVVGLFAHYLFAFSVLEGMLLGAVISPTDAAAVFSVLRTRSVGLKASVRPLVELESGSNDPMSVFLTTGLLSLIAAPGSSPWALVPRFVIQMALGLLLGYALGKLVVFAANRMGLEHHGLYPVMTFAFVLLSYGLTDALGGNGFLAVYVVGLVMGNSRFLHKRSLLHFTDSIAWLMQITMFLVLGLLVFPSRLLPVVGRGVLLSLFLILLARPIAVYGALAFSRLTLREKALVSWVGLRGAVPIILATYPLLAGIPRADYIFNLVFFVILTSTLIQGPSIPLVARVLRLDTAAPERRYYPLQYEPSAGSDNQLLDVSVPGAGQVVGKTLVEIGLPRGALAVLINRDGRFLVPDGSTTLQAGDHVSVLADESVANEVRLILSARTAAHPPP